MNVSFCIITYYPMDINAALLSILSYNHLEVPWVPLALWLGEYIGDRRVIDDEVRVSGPAEEGRC